MDNRQREENKAPRKRPLESACAFLGRYRFLFMQLVSRDFRAKYKRSVLGVVWSLLNPLLTMAVQYVVFSTLFRTGVENYPVYLLIGIVCFNFFNEAVSLGMTSITGNAALIKKVYVPKAIFPVARVISSLVNFLISLIPLLLVMLVTGARFHLSLLLLPFDILCLLGFTLGIALILTTAMTFFQDTQFLWGVVSMIWMYLTPIFYPETIIAPRILPLYRLNPLNRFITFARACVIGGVSPGAGMYLACLASAALSLALGALVFRKYQDRFILYL